MIADDPRPTAGFNGAAPMMERKTPVAERGSPDSWKLQWGRSDDGAENARHVDDGPSTDASMGPLR